MDDESRTRLDALVREEQPRGARTAKWIISTIAIAALAMGGFLIFEKTRVARAEAQGMLVYRKMKALAAAIDGYRESTNAFVPYAADEFGTTIDTQTWPGYPVGLEVNGFEEDLHDAFAGNGRPLRYWTDQKAFFIWSTGKDGDYDLKAPADYAAQTEANVDRLAGLSYDPTNGVSSTGDAIILHFPELPER